MRIAIFTEIYFPYTCGISTNVFLLSENLKALGHEVLIVTSDLKATGLSITDGVLRCPAKAAKNQYGLAITAPASPELFNKLEKFKPEILHLHTVSPIGQAAIKFAGRLDLPMVFTIHDYFEDQLPYLSSRLLESAARMAAKNRFKDCAENADIITSASKKASDYLKACKINRKLTFVPNNTDVNAFDYAKVSSVAMQQVRRIANISADKTVAIFSGRLTLEKSTEVLLEQWANQVKSTSGLHLLIVGDGPEKDPLIAWAKDLGIEKQVSFVGEVSHEKMPAYYAASDFFVSASKSDMMSMAVLEATACGLPCIIPHVAGGNEEIKEGINGFTYKTEQEFGKYVKQFATLDADGRRILKKMVRRSTADIPVSQQAAKMLAAYNSAIDLHYYNPNAYRSK